MGGSCVFNISFTNDPPGCGYNCTSCELDLNCTNCGLNAGLGTGFGIMAGVFLVIGLAMGIACSIVAYKFVNWMEGKFVVFTPWPKIRSSRSQDAGDTTLHNPTYEIGGTPTNPTTAKSALKKTPQQHRTQHDMYEAVDEPTNEAESNFDAAEPTLLPYAIHDFSEAGGRQDLEKGKGSVGGGKPTKSQFKSASDNRRSMSESETQNKRTRLKPPIAKKKPGGIQSRTSSQTGRSAEPPHAAYSELDKKTSYATLEPHMGPGDPRMMEGMGFEEEMRESYRHLNH